MFGKIEFCHYVIFFLSLVAAVTDLTWGKIFNWLTFPSILIGIFYSGYAVHGVGVPQALMGSLGGLLFYGWIYGLGFMGAGDVKLLMALGAWGGFDFVQKVAFLGIILGGVFGFFLIVFSGRFFQIYRKFYTFFLSIFIHELEFIPPKIDKTLKMPFGVPIAVAAIWVLFGHFF